MPMPAAAFGKIHLEVMDVKILNMYHLCQKGIIHMRRNSAMDPDNGDRQICSMKKKFRYISTH